MVMLNQVDLGSTPHSSSDWVLGAESIVRQRKVNAKVNSEYSFGQSLKGGRILEVEFARARLPCLFEVWVSFGQSLEVDSAIRWALG